MHLKLMMMLSTVEVKARDGTRGSARPTHQHPSPDRSITMSATLQPTGITTTDAELLDRTVLAVR
ncbi:hypothetical protein, partial [Streptomyces sp. NPDC092307]|uniref:hypothetical protein n=1 Tax=Streptomyces sp. NPDC092307 TaxID=3366013 RepID=UPI0038175A0D